MTQELKDRAYELAHLCFNLRAVTGMSRTEIAKECKVRPYLIQKVERPAVYGVDPSRFHPTELNKIEKGLLRIERTTFGGEKERPLLSIILRLNHRPEDL